MSKVRATNDPLIEQMIADPEWRVLEDGTIETTRCRRSGRRTNVWRLATWEHSHGGTNPYMAVRYRGRKLAAHRIVYRALIGPLDNTLTINHKDGNPSNNHPRNLELVTQGENNLHAYRSNGRAPVAGNAKLTPAGVQMIRDDLEAGLPQGLIAAKFRVSAATVSMIKTGTIWRDAP